MLSNAYFVAKFRFDTAENEPAKNLRNFRKMHFSKWLKGPAHRAPRPEDAAMQRSASVPFLPGQVVSAGPGERANHRRPQTLIYKLDAPVRATEKLRSANCVKFLRKHFQKMLIFANPS